MNELKTNGDVKSGSEMKKIERRTYTVQDVEARQSDDGTMRLRGYAAVFNDSSLPLPFKEIIAPGAFRKTLSETPDVRFLINHEGLPLARTKNGTLTLTEDSRGLMIDAEIADTTEGRDLYKLIERGDVDQMSFAFRVIRQKWNEDRSVRTLTEVSLSDGDISAVTYPAYPTTSIEAREALRHAIDAVKEGREVTGESLIVLKTIFDDLSEGHEYIMKAVEMMAMMTGEDKVEEVTVDFVPEVMLEEAGRSISLRLAKAMVKTSTVKKKITSRNNPYRDSDGRFGSGSGASGGNSKESELAKDISPNLKKEYGDTSETKRAQELRVEHMTANYDPVLKDIAKKQGFDAKAEMVDQANFDKIVADGGTVTYRGVTDFYDSPSANDATYFQGDSAISQNFAEGEYYAGGGGYGSGTYTSSDLSIAEHYATADGATGGVITMVVRPDAKIATPQQWQAARAAAREGKGGFMGAENEGRILAAQGFDGFQIASKNVDHFSNQFTVVLNRNAVAVLKK